MLPRATLFCKQVSALAESRAKVVPHADWDACDPRLKRALLLTRSELMREVGTAGGVRARDLHLGKVALPLAELLPYKV